MKTAIEELIEWNNTKDRFWVISWVELDAKLKEAKEKEREQIESAFNLGMNFSEDYFEPNSNLTESQNYYEKTFKK